MLSAGGDDHSHTRHTMAFTCVGKFLNDPRKQECGLIPAEKCEVCCLFTAITLCCICGQNVCVQNGGSRDLKPTYLPTPPDTSTRTSCPKPTDMVHSGTEFRKIRTLTQVFFEELKLVMTGTTKAKKGPPNCISTFRT